MMGSSAILSVAVSAGLAGAQADINRDSINMTSRVVRNLIGDSPWFVFNRQSSPRHGIINPDL
jgi:hypothetical protein